MKRLQKHLKRVLAFVLSVAMLAGGIWYGTTSEAADSQISFSSADAINYWAASDGESAYVLWLKADVNLTSSYYTGVKYEVSDGTNVNNYEFSAVGIYNGMFNMRIPYTNLPKPDDMTSAGKTYTLTFKAGDIESAEGTKVAIKEDFSILLKDGNRLGIVDTIHTDVTYIAGAKNVINIWPTPAPALTAGDGYYHRAVSGQLRYGDGSATQTAKLDGIYRWVGADYYYMPLPDAVSNSMKTGSIVVFEDVLVQDAVDTSRLVRLPNLCYQYTEGADPCWKKIEEPKDITYTAMDLTFYNASNDAAKTYWDMYFDTDAKVPGTAWTTAFADVKATVGDKPIVLSVKKSGDQQLNVFISDTTTLPIPPAKGTVLTIQKGKYKDTTDTCGIEIKNDYQLTWNGSKWSTEAVAQAEDITIKGIQVKAFSEENSRWNIYVDVEGKIPGDAWDGVFTGLSYEINGNTVAVPEVYKHNDNTLFFYIAENKLPYDFTGNVKIVLKAGTATHSKTGTKDMNLTSDFTMYVNEYGWATDDYPKAPTYEKLSFTGLDPETGYNSGAGLWFMYLTPSKELPGTVDSTFFTGLKMSVDGGRKQDVTITKASHGNSAFIYFGTDVLKEKITKDTKLTIHAGKALSNDGSDGIELGKDFTIYINEYGCSAKGFIRPTSYQKVSFTGLDPETGYNSGAGLWFMYITPSKELPGTADSTFFTGLEMSINGKNRQKVRVTKASHGNSAFIYFGTDVLKEKITKDTKLTIHAGKALSSDGSAGLQLSKDFTIYINEYGCSAKGFIRPTSYKKVTFTGLDPATGFSSAAKAWCLYIEPSSELPGTADSTFFTGLEMSINGKNRQKVRVTKASHGNSAFIYFGTDVLPSKITKNTKLTLHAGKAISSDESAGIWLTKDCVLYANKYGISTKGYLKPVKVVQKNVQVALDRNTSFGGNENGLYLTTTDKFPVDTTWATRIKAISYDNKSGIFLNGQKIDGQLIRFADGKVYVALADAGVTAKDKDKVTIKGTFALESTGITFKEISFYFNGKTWNTKYEKAKKETYQAFAVNSVNKVTGWNEEYKRWNVYLDVNALLPGEIDNIYFENLVVEVNGKKIDTTVYHSYQDTLFFPIEGKYLSKNVKDGSKITIKAGKAIATDKSTGIRLTKDFTFYTYKGSMSAQKPTNNTKWQQLTINGMLATGSYHEDSKVWDFHVKLRQPLTTETGTNYLQLPIKVNGKSYTITAMQDGDYLYMSIPDSALPGTTKKATITIEKGAKAYANAGHDGFQVQETWTTYVFNGVISEREFEEIEKYEGNILGVQNVMPYTDGYHVYLRLNKEFPGSAWYEKYEDFIYYYNNKEIKTTARKSDSSNGKFMYFPIEKYLVGESKEGDVVEIKKGMKLTCGGYEFTVTNDFMLMFNDGIWSQYVETDVKAPEDIGSLWSVARFEEGYIPVATNGSVLYSNEDTYNKIVSTEAMKDYTISFNAKKFYDDETSPSFGVILRGNPVNDTDPMTKELLYGYVVTFSAFEYKEDPASKEEGVWTGYLNLWKNGENYSLLDQYRVSYVYDQSDHPYFQYEKDYNYEFSIYNITETCVCITVKVNGKLVMRYYDEAGSDPFDPAINAGTFEVYAGCPNYITDDVVELSEILAEKTECMVGDRVRVAATYPSVLEGAEFTVDKDGATITEGAFVATKPGTYTVSGTYNGKELTPVTITVTKSETQETAEETTFPVIPVAAAGVVVLAGVIAIIILSKKKKNTKESNE